jgi:hypothetical protein
MPNNEHEFGSIMNQFSLSCASYTVCKLPSLAQKLITLSSVSSPKSTKQFTYHNEQVQRRKYCLIHSELSLNEYFVTQDALKELVRFVLLSLVSP